MRNLPKNEKGETLYPVCSFEKNQHKLYNAHDRIMNAIYDARESNAESQELYGRQEEIERLLSVFNGYVHGGLAYATYADGIKIKDIIAAYDARH